MLILAIRYNTLLFLRPLWTISRKCREIFGGIRRRIPGESTLNPGLVYALVLNPVALELETHIKKKISMITKLAWRLLNNQKLLWVHILQHKYFPKTNPLIHFRNYNKSCFWSSIKKGLDIIGSNYEWQVNCGSNVNIWSDYWLPNQTAARTPICIDDEMPIIVNQLTDENGNWNNTMIEKYIHPSMYDRIKPITLNIDMPDRIRWKFTVSGECTTKSAYHFLSNNETYNNEKDFWKFLWKINCIPRIKLFC